MRRWVGGSLRHAARALAYGVSGGLVVLVAIGVSLLESRPDLEVWHTARLEAEFDARSDVGSFDEYLALEDDLFEQLHRQVYDRIEPRDRLQIARFNAGSLSDPERWPKNWNRSFELPAAEPRGGALLIHGLSDSPYSMRSLGQRLHAEGFWVVGLRVPGHGTAPSGLLRVRWQEMAAAVRLAMRHLHERVGERPVSIVGYSNGGALAVQHALTALEDERVVAPDRLVLLSPQIGITRLAALAVWQQRLGHLFGLRKLAWSSIVPEYDPYKYGSFAINAGQQAYLLTRNIRSRIEALAAEGRLEDFPATIAFQSVVDATVSAAALATELFERLPAAEHELVLFDINRFSDIEMVLRGDPVAWLDPILERPGRRYTITVISNEHQGSANVVAREHRPGAAVARVSALGLAWPRDVYSLSHVALPFPPDDPVYGGDAAGPTTGIRLGALAFRGERGVLRIGAADMLRLRWNPFHAYLERRMSAWLRGPSRASSSRPSEERPSS